jgi:hypothetical protein
MINRNEGDLHHSEIEPGPPDSHPNALSVKPTEQFEVSQCKRKHDYFVFTNKRVAHARNYCLNILEYFVTVFILFRFHI